MTSNFWKIFRYLVTAVILLITITVVINMLIFFGSKAKVFSSIDDLSEAEVVIILGARVYGDGKLSPIFKERVDTAVVVYSNKKVKKILVSGDNGSLEYNEVAPVREYLLSLGIPSADIFLDYAGFDTYDTMYRAKNIFAIKSAIVVTQPFHIHRAVYLGNSLKINTQGMVTEEGDGTIKNYFREFFANIKAMGDVVLKSESTYLGNTVPITGNGEATLGQ